MSLLFSVSSFRSRVFQKKNKDVCHWWNKGLFLFSDEQTTETYRQDGWMNIHLQTGWMDIQDRQTFTDEINAQRWDVSTDTYKQDGQTDMINRHTLTDRTDGLLQTM